MTQAVDVNVMDRLKRALYPVDPANMDGQFYMRTPGGSGGTSTTDNSAFTPGTSSLTPMGGYYGGRQVGSGNVAAPAIDGSGVLQVNVIAGGAGGGNAQLQVQGTAANWQNVGFASGNAGAAGNWAVPIKMASGYYPTLNMVTGLTFSVNVVNTPDVHVTAGSIWVANGAAFATVAVYGSPGFPVYNIGTVNVSNSVTVLPGATFTISLDNIPTVNLGLGTVNIGNIPVVDTRNAKVPTMFPIKATTSGVTLICSGLFPYSVYGVKLITDATVDVYFVSPSGGTALEGTMRLLPGAGFAENNHLSSPLYSCPSGLFIVLSGNANVGGVVRGVN